MSYQKKDGCTWPRPLFFWYETDFTTMMSLPPLGACVCARPSFGITMTFQRKKKKKKKFAKKSKKLVSYQSRPSSGMTTTPDIRDLFLRHSPIIHVFVSCLALLITLNPSYEDTYFSVLIHPKWTIGMFCWYVLLDYFITRPSNFKIIKQNVHGGCVF